MDLGISGFSGRITNNFLYEASNRQKCADKTPKTPKTRIFFTQFPTLREDIEIL